MAVCLRSLYCSLTVEHLRIIAARITPAPAIRVLMSGMRRLPGQFHLGQCEWPALSGRYLIVRASPHPAVVVPSSGGSAAVPEYGHARHGVLLRCGHGGICPRPDAPFRGRDGQPHGAILSGPCVQSTVQYATTVSCGFGVGVRLQPARVVSSNDTLDAGCVPSIHPAAAVLLFAGRIHGIEGVHIVPDDGLCHDR